MPDHEERIVRLKDELIALGKAHQNGDWLRCRCPYHDDDTPSASFNLTTGILKCFGCQKTAGIRELEHHFHLVPPRGHPKVERTLSEDAVRTVRYVYRWPDGRLSHQVIRYEFANGRKTFKQYSMFGVAGLPAEHWPVYTTRPLESHAIVVVVEGEGCVEAIDRQDLIDDGPVRGVTLCGGSGSVRKYVARLAQFLKTVRPKQVILWPDHDQPGRTMMREIGQSFDQHNIGWTQVDPQDLDLTEKADVVDYLLQGRSLQAALDRAVTPLQATSPFVDAVLVLDHEQFVFPTTRQPVPIDHKNIPAAFRQLYGKEPTHREIREIQSTLLARSHVNPIRRHSRMLYAADAFIWRGTETGKAAIVSKTGISVCDDPQGSIIMLPPGQPIYPTQIDQGRPEHLNRALSLFAISETAKDLIEGWLVATLTGSYTPILYIRGNAGSGKTTLARFVLAVVEPHGPEWDSNPQHQDQRELIRLLEHYHAFLIDNVGSLRWQTEDLLSKLVTETALHIRPMYTDAVELIRLHRSVIVTTVTWDVYKSDLASRIVPVMTAPLSHVAADETITAQLADLMPFVRGYIWSRCVEYYQRRKTASPNGTQFRMGGYGATLAALGYDADALAQKMQEERATALTQHDGWMQSLVDYWTTHQRGLCRPKDLCAKIADETGDQVHPNRLGKYIEEKREMFKDAGFTIERDRDTVGNRVYRFSEA